MGSTSKTKTLACLIAPLAGALFSATAAAQEPACPFYENRSGLCGYYNSEVSPARAYLETVEKRSKRSSHKRQPVILDVRSTPEYKAGHPEDAYNVPYPYIYQYCDTAGRSPDGACAKSKIGEIAQDPVAFANYVAALFPDKSTPIYVLCRTGVRSVGAGNILADRGYTDVHNIWEGFVGVNLTAPKVQADGTVKVMPVDLDHDGAITDEDKNGWRYHQGLPFETRLQPPLLYAPYRHLYYWND